MAATTNPLARLGVGLAIVPAAMTTAAIRARSVFLIESSMLTTIYMNARQRNALIKIKA
jgi:hypothetical protein